LWQGLLLLSNNNNRMRLRGFLESGQHQSHHDAVG
jgi:hypothetical protein